MAFDMSDYVDVADRLRELFAKYPDARLSGSYEFRDVNGVAHVIYRAECHRSADDPLPGVGTAWEEIPGKTPYTKGSEIQNAETSAWGRAILAIGASQSKRIASANEVRSAQARQSPVESGKGPEVPPPTSGPTIGKNKLQGLLSRAKALRADDVPLAEPAKARGLPKITANLSPEQGDEWDALLSEIEATLTAPFVETPA